MRAIWTFLVIGAAMVGWFGTGPAASLNEAVNDVSWPQCGSRLSREHSGIVGITGGLALRPNPCLSTEAGLYKYLSVYINTGYPGPQVARKFQTSGPKECLKNDKVCLAYNYGYNNSIYSLKYALMNGVVAKKWWLDVETENSWDDSVQVNRAAIQGGIDGLSWLVGKNNVGVYSYPGQWDLITGKWRNHAVAWVATGSTFKSDAELACRTPSFTGGPVFMTQYTPNLDVNLICR